MYGDSLNSVRSIADQIIASTQVTPETAKQDSDVRKGLASRTTQQVKGAMQDVTDQLTGDTTSVQEEPNNMMASYIASINQASQEARTSIAGVQDDLVQADYQVDAQGRPTMTDRPQSRADRTPTAPEEIQSLISSAAQRMGVNGEYLTNLAYAESSFDPNAQAKNSSAGGLFQFVDDTWLSVVRKHGDIAGLDTENMTRNQLLSLKFDPKINSLMGAAFARDNQTELEDFLDRDIRPADLYAMHFFGRTGGKTFISNYEAEPNAIAADIISDRVVNANRNIFYREGDRSRPRTMSQVYNLLGFKVNG